MGCGEDPFRSACIFVVRCELRRVSTYAYGGSPAISPITCRLVPPCGRAAACPSISMAVKGGEVAVRAE